MGYSVPLWHRMTTHTKRRKPRKERVVLRVPEELMDLFLKAAADENRSLSNYVLTAAALYTRQKEDAA